MHTNTHYHFWLVWNPEGRSPTYKHQSEQSARTEAIRLAKENTGKRFYVLKSLGHAHVAEPVQYEKHEEQPCPF